MDLKTKLALALVSAALLSMGALGAFTWVWARGMFVEEAERRLAARAESRAAEVARVFARFESELAALATRPDLPDLDRVLEDGDATEALAASLGATPDVGETGETLVVVPDGSLVLSSSPEGGVLAKPSASGREVLAATRFLPEGTPGAGVGVMVQVDRAEVQARADRLRTDMNDLALALAAFAILGGTLLGFRLARPIQRLVENVDLIRHGEIGLRLDVEGEDEVAFLAMSLNEFMDQLDRSSDLFQLGELEVLLLDGDARSRRVLEDLLQNWNLRPSVAESRASALDAFEAAERRGRPFQLVVLDESTTDTNGHDLAAALRGAGRSVCPIITLAPSADPAKTEKTAEAEKTAEGRQLPKPVIASHLMEAILEEMGVSAESLASPTEVYLRPTEPRRILLVEDSRLIQQVMLGFLEGWGHEVTCVANGRLAVERARAERFDLILMDVEMPELDGLAATQAIRAQESEEPEGEGGGERIPIIALTAEARPGDRERCLAAGMNDYIPKPADPKRLYAIINRCPPRALAEPAPPAVDWELARSHTGGDAELLREVVGLFPEESRRQLDAIEQGARAGDPEAVTRNAHSLKGAAKLFGATTVVEAAFAVENLGREGRLGEVPERLAGLRAETERLCAALADPSS